MLAFTLQLCCIPMCMQAKIRLFSFERTFQMKSANESKEFTSPIRRLQDYRIIALTGQWRESVTSCVTV